MSICTTLHFFILSTLIDSLSDISSSVRFAHFFVCFEGPGLLIGCSCVEELVETWMGDTGLRSRRLGDEPDSAAWSSIKEHLQAHRHCKHAGWDRDQAETRLLLTLGGLCIELVVDFLALTTQQRVQQFLPHHSNPNLDPVLRYAWTFPRAERDGQMVGLWSCRLKYTAFHRIPRVTSCCTQLSLVGVCSTQFWCW